MSNNVKRITMQYTKDYNTEVVKLVRKIGNTKAAIELGLPKSAFNGNANISVIDNTNLSIDETVIWICRAY